MLRVKTMRWLALLMLAGASMAANPVAHAAGDAIPAECVTKTRIQPRTPGWAFVMNFDVFDGANPRGCLMLYRVVYAPTDFVPVACARVGGIGFSGGQAFFDGGYVQCKVNVQEELAALTPPAAVPAIDAYPYFTIIAAGTFGSPSTTSSPFSNPVGVYAPENTAVPGLGLYAPLRSFQTPQMVTLFNNVTSTSAINVSLGTPYTLTVEHDGGPDVYTTTHYFGNAIAGQYAPRGPVQFSNAGGTFFAGFDPARPGETFRGSLDEVIFDPPDGGRPPLFALDQYLIFAPAVVKQP